MRTLSVTVLRHMCAATHVCCDTSISAHSKHYAWITSRSQPSQLWGKKDEGVLPSPLLLPHSTLWPPARWYIQMDSIHLPLGLRIQAGNYYRTNLSFSLLFYQLYFILYSSRFRTSCMALWEGIGNPNWGIGFSHTPNTPENPMQDYGKET